MTNLIIILDMCKRLILNAPRSEVQMRISAARQPHSTVAQEALQGAQLHVGEAALDLLLFYQRLIVV